MRKKHFLNNYRIKIKLVLIFVFCVMIPLIVTNMVMISLMDKYSKKDQLNNLNKQIDSVEYSVSSAVTACISATNDMYKDRQISDFLDYKYKDGSEFFTSYTQLVTNNLKHYYYGSLIISKITVYGDNETLVNGGYIFKVSSVKDTGWYKTLSRYDSSNMPVIVYVDYDDSSPGEGSRKISIIKRLDYFNKHACEKIVKIDMDYNALVKNISSNQIVGTVYVCDENRIILDNQSAFTRNKNFESVENVDMSKVGASRKIEGFAKNWSIYLTADETNIWTELAKDWKVYAIMIFVNLLLPSIIILCVGNSFKIRILLMESKMNKMKEEQFETLTIEPGHDEIGKLIITYNLMVNKIKELIEVVYKEKVEKQELELAKKEAELTALHAQIDPHFLFNILENLRMRSLIKKEDETADIIGELSIMMRKSYDWGKDLITVREEVEFARAYLKLQKYRFGDKLSFVFNICEDCYDVKIPKLTIVTFVENAVVHGIEKVTRDGRIVVLINKELDYMLIKIVDSGRGIKEEKLLDIRKKIYKKSVGCLNNAESIGMLNAYNRLFINFGNKLEVTIDSEEDVGTIVMIKIPIDMLKK